MQVSAVYSISCVRKTSEVFRDPCAVAGLLNTDIALRQLMLQSHDLLNQAGIAKLRVRITPFDGAQKEFRIVNTEKQYEAEAVIVDSEERYDIIEWTRNTSLGLTQTKDDDRKVLEGVIYKISKVILAVKPAEMTLPNIQGQNIFRLGLYTAYLEKLRVFVSSLKDKYPLLFATDDSLNPLFRPREANDLVLHIMEGKTNDIPNQPKFHAQFHSFLRTILRNYQFDDGTPVCSQIRGFADELVTWMYTGVEWEDELENIMRAVFADLDFNLNPDIEDAICAVNDKFITEFEKSKIIPRTDLQSIGYLQHRYFNYPHPNQKRVSKFIHTANPTFKERSKKVYEIISEMIHFCSLLERTNESYAYFNALVLPDKDPNRDTSMRKAIETLRRHRGVRVITLNRDGDFYKGIDKFSDKNYPKLGLWEVFREEIIQQLVYSEDNCCFWNEDDKKAVEVHLRSLVDRTKDHYFKDKLRFSELSRRAFQDMVFVEYIEQYLVDNSISHFSIACNSTNDRGPSLYTLFKLKCLLRESGGYRPEHTLKIVTSLFVHALINENRGADSVRLKVFMYAASAIIKAGPMNVLSKVDDASSANR